MSTKTLSTPTFDPTSAMLRPRFDDVSRWTLGGAIAPVMFGDQGMGLSCTGTTATVAHAYTVANSMISMTPVQDGDAATGVAVRTGAPPRGAPA